MLPVLGAQLGIDLSYHNGSSSRFTSFVARDGSWTTTASVSSEIRCCSGLARPRRSTGTVIEVHTYCHRQHLTNLKTSAMRLVLTRPSHHYINIDECLYRCDCGEEAEFLMMRAA